MAMTFKLGVDYLAMRLRALLVAAVLINLIMISSSTTTSYREMDKTRWSTMGADSSVKDREECTQQLVGMATCLPYVGGEAKSPTPDCCSGLKQVLVNNKKCLCVIIQDRNDPQLGLHMNVTLALGLPSVCKAPANVSKCPELLHLDPKSPEAQIFYQLEANSTQTSNTSHLAPTPSVQGPLIAKSGTAGGNIGNGLLQWKARMVVVTDCSWCFASLLLFYLFV